MAVQPCSLANHDAGQTIALTRVGINLKLQFIGTCFQHRHRHFEQVRAVQTTHFFELSTLTNTKKLAVHSHTACQRHFGHVDAHRLIGQRGQIEPQRVANQAALGLEVGGCHRVRQVDHFFGARALHHGLLELSGGVWLV